jgi:hypothetical protein
MVRGVLIYMGSNPSNTSGVDDGGMLLVDAAGRRWQRQIEGPIQVKYWGGRTITNIQKAMDYAVDVLGAGGEVDLDYGTYTGSTTLKFRRNIRLVGKGHSFTGATTISLNAGANVPLAMNDTANGPVLGTGEDGRPQRSANVYVEGINFIASGQTAYSADALWLKNAWTVTFKECQFFADKGFALRLQDCNAVDMQKCFTNGLVYMESVADSHFGGGTQSGPTNLPSVDNEDISSTVWINNASVNNLVSDWFVYNAGPGKVWTLTATGSSSSITSTSHGLAEGTPLNVSYTTAPGGWTYNNATMFVHVINANTIALATSRINALNGTYITPSSAGSGLTARIGDKANFYISDSSWKNAFSNIRMDQGYWAGGLVRRSRSNTFTNCQVFENGRTNGTGQPGFLLTDSANDNNLIGFNAEGTPVPTATGSPLQTIGLQIDISAARNKVTGMNSINHSSSDFVNKALSTRADPWALPNNVYSEVMFPGLFGDSSTDNFNALQYMANTLPKGATIRFTAKGKYKLSGMVMWPNTVHIEIGPGVSFQQMTDYTSMFYFNQDSSTVKGGIWYQTGKGDENDFPRGYGSAFVFQDVQYGCEVSYASIYNCGDYLNPGVVSPRNGTYGTGKLTSSSGVYITRSGRVYVHDNFVTHSITAINTDGYQNKNIGTPGHKVIGFNNIFHNEVVDCWQGFVIDGLDSAGLADAFPGWITNNILTKTTAYTGGGTIGVKLFTNLSNKGVIVQGNEFQGRWSAGVACLTGSLNTKIIGNTFDSCYDAVSLFSSGRTVRNILVSGNTFNMSAHSDVYMNGVYQSKVIGNISTGALNGVILDNLCFNITLATNDIFKASNSAVTLISAYGTKIMGGNMIDCGTLTTGDTSAISINPANASGVVYNTEITGVTFDVATTGGTPALLTKYAVRAHGSYALANANTGGAGKVHDNTFGRTIAGDDLSERTFGLLYRNNQGPGNYDTASANFIEARYDAATKSTFTTSSTGTLTLTPVGSTPAISLPVATTASAIFSATAGIQTNTTPNNGNFYTFGSTGVTSGTNSRGLYGGQTSVIYSNWFGGSTGATMTGTAVGARNVFPTTDWTLNGTNYAVGQIAISAPNLITGTGTAQNSYNLLVEGYSTNATRPTGLWVRNSRIGVDGSLPFSATPGNDVAMGADSNLVQKASMNSLNLASSTSLTMTITKRNWVFTGSTATTWTLPAVSGNSGNFFFIKNRGSAAITLTAAGADNLYNTAAVTTITISAGQAYYIFNDGTYWLVE